MIVELLDGLTFKGHLNGWSSIRAIEQAGVGAWELKAPLNDGNRSLLSEWEGYDLPGFGIRDEETGWRYVGFMTSHRLDEVVDEGLSLVAVGVDFNQLLVDRLARPSANEADWWQYATATSGGDPVALATTFLQLAGIFVVDAQRTPPWSCDVFAAASALPGTTVRAQGAECLRLINELLEGTGYYLRRTFVPELTGVTLGVLQWEIAQRPVSQTRFSVRDGNIKRVSVERTAATGTEIIGVGEEIGAGPAREVRTASGFDGTWRRRYIEHLENQPSMTGAELQDHVDRQLAIRGPKTIVTAVDPSDSLWGTDLDVGWLAEVSVPSLAGPYSYEQLPVAQVTLTGAPTNNGDVWERKVEFGGRELRDFSKLAYELGQVKASVDDAKRLVR